MTEERYRVQSVERAFALLEALADAGPDGMTLSNLARLLGVSKSTAYAILQTLLAGGFVADAGAGMSRRYRLGMALARLGDVVVTGRRAVGDAIHLDGHVEVLGPQRGVGRRRRIEHRRPSAQGIVTQRVPLGHGVR